MLPAWALVVPNSRQREDLGEYRPGVDSFDMAALGVIGVGVVERRARHLENSMAGSPRAGLLRPRRSEQSDDRSPHRGRGVHRAAIATYGQQRAPVQA